MSILALPPNKVFSDNAYYSTQPFVAWCLNHYVYDKVHYVWCSRYLFPYRAMNPKSSNPYQIFADLYHPSFDQDQFDSFLAQMRIKLRKGVEAQVQSTTSNHPYATRYNDLLDICDHIDETFFWPILYLIRYDVATDPSRATGANSALVGSLEALVKDLQETEFTLLVPDFDRQSPLKDDIGDFVMDSFTKGNDAVDQLLKRS